MAAAAENCIDDGIGIALRCLGILHEGRENDDIVIEGQSHEADGAEDSVETDRKLHDPRCQQSEAGRQGRNQQKYDGGAHTSKRQDECGHGKHNDNGQIKKEIATASFRFSASPPELESVVRRQLESLSLQLRLDVFGDIDRKHIGFRESKNLIHPLTIPACDSALLRS